MGGGKDGRCKRARWGERRELKERGLVVVVGGKGLLVSGGVSTHD
jgi:hypothetical protein